MANFTRIPRYDVRNDGFGPYAVFYCEACDREFRSQPDVAGSVAQDIGRQTMGGLLRKIPLVGGVVADNVTGEDPRYTYKMTQAQVEKAWGQVQQHFRQCPTCTKIVCLSDFDTQSGYCNEDSPRTEEIAESRGAQAGAALKGFANAFGLGGVMDQAENAMKRAQDSLAHCPKCGAVAEAGTKFCPECGSAMAQPVPAAKCPSCGADTKGAKFCPECGTKIEAAPTRCPNCGAEAKGAKFCPECGTKIA